jgi:hypothetical protein
MNLERKRRRGVARGTAFWGNAEIIYINTNIDI